MNTKNKLAVGVVAVTAFGLALAIPVGVMAQNSTDSSTSFVEMLAEKLGINQDTLQTALDETREARHEERVAEMEAKINDAVEAGDLTARQAELLAAMRTYREENRPERPQFDESFRDMTREERQAQMEQRHEEMQQEMVDALNEQGLNTNSDELEELRDAMKELGFGGRKGRMGPGGYGSRGGFNFRDSEQS